MLTAACPIQVSSTAPKKQFRCDKLRRAWSGESFLVQKKLPHRKYSTRSRQQASRNSRRHMRKICLAKTFTDLSIPALGRGSFFSRQSVLVYLIAELSRQDLEFQKCLKRLYQFLVALESVKDTGGIPDVFLKVETKMFDVLARKGNWQTRLQIT